MEMQLYREPQDRYVYLPPLIQHTYRDPGVLPQYRGLVRSAQEDARQARDRIVDFRHRD